MTGNTPASPQISSRMIHFKNEVPKGLRFYASTMQSPYFISLYYSICISCITIFQSCCFITVSGIPQHCQDGYGEMQNKQGSPHIGKSLIPMKIEEKSQPELNTCSYDLGILLLSACTTCSSKPVAPKERRDMRIY